jgi:hypothetical protein
MKEIQKNNEEQINVLFMNFIGSVIFKKKHFEIFQMKYFRLFEIFQTHIST